MCLEAASMRKFAFLLIVAGLGIGAIWPWAQGNFLNDEIERVSMTGLRENGSVEAIVNLKTSDNPVRIRFLATFLPDGKLPPVRLPLTAKISDRQGTLLAGIVSFATDGLTTGPELPTQSGSQALNLTVVNDGPHALSLTFAENAGDGGISRPDIEKVSATFIRNARVIDDQYTLAGFIVAMLGFYLLVRSRRSGKKSGIVTFGRKGADR